MSTATPNYSSGNDRFDAEAATWDSKPEVVESSRLCLQGILSHDRHFPDLASSNVLEIGCGTGLLTVPLAQHVQSIVALDTAQGMIDMLNSKLPKQGVQGKVEAKVKLLEDTQDPMLGGKKFDVVVSHLVFHHVPNMTDLVKVMKGTLKQGGRVWISDFEDNGVQAEAFHPRDKVSIESKTGPNEHRVTNGRMFLPCGPGTACWRGTPWSEAHRDGTDSQRNWLQRC